MSVACFAATAVFACFAALQLNDLPQYGTRAWGAWVALYAATSALSFVRAFRPVPAAVTATAAVLTLAAAGWRARSIDWNGAVLYNESNPAGNETGGLLIVAAWLGFLTVSTLRNARRRQEPAQGT